MSEYEMATLEISRAGLEISRWHMMISAVGTLLSSSLIAWGLWLMTKASRNRSREIDELARTFRQQGEAQIEALRQQGETLRQQGAAQVEALRQQGETLRQQGETLRQQGEGQVEALRQQSAALAELLRRTA